MAERSDAQSVTQNHGLAYAALRWAPCGHGAQNLLLRPVTRFVIGTSRKRAYSIAGSMVPRLGKTRHDDIPQ
jgi:hypothetical protein